MIGQQRVCWLGIGDSSVCCVCWYFLMHFRQCNSLTSCVMHENKGFGSLCLCNSANWRVGKVCRDERKRKKKKKSEWSGVEDKPRESSSENREQAAYPCIISKS